MDTIDSMLEELYVSAYEGKEHESLLQEKLLAILKSVPVQLLTEHSMVILLALGRLLSLERNRECNRRYEVYADSITMELFSRMTDVPMQVIHTAEEPKLFDPTRTSIPKSDKWPQLRETLSKHDVICTSDGRTMTLQELIDSDISTIQTTVIRPNGDIIAEKYKLVMSVDGNVDINTTYSVQPKAVCDSDQLYTDFMQKVFNNADAGESRSIFEIT